MSRKLKYGLATVAAAIVPGLAAPSAMAAPNETANCLYQGTAHTSGVGVLANSGTYNFSSFVFTCSGTDANDTGETTADGTINLSSTGTFTNTVCGTGTATGSATVESGNVADFPVGTTTNYSITFAGGEGALFASGNDADGSFTANGSTSIAADPGPGFPNATFCTDNFQVVGDAEFFSTDTTPGT